MANTENPAFAKAIKGKTVSRVEYDSVNVIRLWFTDGTNVEIWAECGSGDFAIPRFEIVIK